MEQDVTPLVRGARSVRRLGDIPCVIRKGSAYPSILSVA
ncbi:unnamed protein product [[Actinomadura] parvosata subsp. kistnae]|nr:unnamed protein product [Actinomadura parvosata subsp. kistnae]